eukprot:TRINITY_DN44250_c0_g1_i1.p1 TRINITY_DN44250_c0_g1~~TRINITY_DN44250_c0_g1_i1.p1  ORF type:complete len:402 (-),score=45.18 TRINITY_DN44250_c0_g1_i1:149-1354(-)
MVGSEPQVAAGMAIGQLRRGSMHNLDGGPVGTAMRSVSNPCRSLTKGNGTGASSETSSVSHGTADVQLASFDWPPPPSPALSLTRRFDQEGNVSTTALKTQGSVAWSSDIGCNALFGRSTSRNPDAQARTKLWSLRDEIEREKLRDVPPYPFFDNSFRFQDDSCLLQLAGDGRFSFATMVGDGQISEFASSEHASNRAVMTYEGVLCNPPLDDPMLDVAKSDAEVATVEGRGMFRYEVEEVVGGTRIVNIERGRSRFAITVSPFFEPTVATVQVQEKVSSASRPPPRHRRLHLVGKGKVAYLDRQSELRRKQRCQSVPKFSRSSAIPLPATTGTSGYFKKRGALGQTRPVSRAMSEPRTLGIRHERPKMTQDNHRDLSDWTDFYRQRSDAIWSEKSNGRQS